VKNGRSIIALLAMLLSIGCVPYPRYNPEAEFTPRQQIAPEQYLTTHQYIQLGMVLQRQLGRPYSGRSKWEEGVDCSQFTRDAFREFNGMQLPRTVAEQLIQGQEVARSRLHFGDLVFFRTDRERVSHVGVYIGFNEFIHVSSSNGVIISNLSEKYWARAFVGARRILLPEAERTTTP
jgi:cell wall-associated NlpC family hydrolase